MSEGLLEQEERELVGEKTDEEACINNELHEREVKWGFSLEELQTTTKVVKILFSNPSLFVGDPYLSDSRLYTMITHDHKTKRENREVYKIIMNEEKSRRQRYKRMQYLKTIQKTTMKRERDSALNALMLPTEDDNYFLQNTQRALIEWARTTTATAATSSLDTSSHWIQSEDKISRVHAANSNNKENSVNEQKQNDTCNAVIEHAEEQYCNSITEGSNEKRTMMVANNNATCHHDKPLAHEVKLLRLIGAFENLIRLEEKYELSNANESATTKVSTTDKNNDLVVEGKHRMEDKQTTKVCEPNNINNNNIGNDCRDWVAITQLTAQYYRYIPHTFSSQMPPPLFPGPVQANSNWCVNKTDNNSTHSCFDEHNDNFTRNVNMLDYTIAGAKLRIAEYLTSAQGQIAINALHKPQVSTEELMQESASLSELSFSEYTNNKEELPEHLDTIDSMLEERVDEEKKEEKTLLKRDKSANVNRRKETEEHHEIEHNEEGNNACLIVQEMEMKDFCSTWLHAPTSSNTTELLILEPVKELFTSVDALRTLVHFDKHGAVTNFNNQDMHSTNARCSMNCEEENIQYNTVHSDSNARKLVRFIAVSFAEFMTIIKECIIACNIKREYTSDQTYNSEEDFTECEAIHLLSSSERFTVAMQSLNVFIARRLYTSNRLRRWGTSPIVIERRPPVAEDEEPDEYNIFDEIQLYVNEERNSSNISSGSSCNKNSNCCDNINDCNAECELSVEKWVSCYTCKIRYNRLHPFYYSMCHLCGEYNYNKRLLSRDLRDKVVLITGCRIKIGYAMTLSLLRCGATVLGLTRFIHEAVARFQQEKDYHVWQHRLHLFAIDLRDLWIVSQFCAFVQQRFPKLFAIINNATQTIARTAAYTAHLRAIEAHPSLPLAETITHDLTANEWYHFFVTHTSVKIGVPSAIELHPRAEPFIAGNVKKHIYHEHHEQKEEEEEECTESKEHNTYNNTSQNLTHKRVESIPLTHNDKSLEMLTANNKQSETSSNINNDNVEELEEHNDVELLVNNANKTRTHLVKFEHHGGNINNDDNKSKKEEENEEEKGVNCHVNVIGKDYNNNNNNNNSEENNENINDVCNDVVQNKTIIFDRYDTQAEESDTREQNSWVLKLAEVHGSEAAEVMAINALAPFIINSKLKQCLLNREGDRVANEERFIINVSAMEGQFYRFKQTTHPHTNMAKAALNMMTRTSGEDYAADGIYMNSVDTGWITDESPKMKKNRRAAEHLLCPLDEIDAAARCLDLIYTSSHVYGKFYKDYKEITW